MSMSSRVEITIIWALKWSRKLQHAMACRLSPIGTIIIFGQIYNGAIVFNGYSSITQHICNCKVTTITKQERLHTGPCQTAVQVCGLGFLFGFV